MDAVALKFGFVWAFFARGNSKITAESEVAKACTKDVPMLLMNRGISVTLSHQGHGQKVE